ncbi:MAG: LytTR family DNA-binding domain-containing protein, partial [Halanaerobiales bacterium]
KLLSYQGPIITGKAGIRTKINLLVKKGEYHAFLYDQDVFKDLFKYLLGIRGQLNNDIEYMDEIVSAEKINKGIWSPEIAYMPDKGGYNPDFTGLELFKFYADFFSGYNLKKAKNTAGLFNLDTDVKLKELPEFRQRLILMSALFASEVRILLLEEPLRDIPAVILEKIDNFFHEELEKGKSILITEKRDQYKIINADTIQLFTYEGLIEVEKEEEEKNAFQKDSSGIKSNNLEELVRISSDALKESSGINSNTLEESARISSDDVEGSASIMSEDLSEVSIKGNNDLDKSSSNIYSDEYKEPYNSEVDKAHKIKKIAVQEDERVILVDYDKILWISTHKGTCTLHTSTKDYQSNKLLKDIEEELTTPPFFRCHRSYIVNLEKIEEVKTWFNGTYNLLIEGGEVPVSRSNAEKMKQILGI